MTHVPGIGVGVNLALLAAILLPNNLDEADVPADVIAEILDLDRHFASDARPQRYDKGRINMYDLVRMHRIEEELEYARRRAEKQERVERQERWQWTFPATGFSDD